MKSGRPSGTILSKTCAVASTEQDMLITASTAGHLACLAALLNAGAGGSITKAEQGSLHHKDRGKAITLITAVENGHENCV